jgi:hypothetical protein
MEWIMEQDVAEKTQNKLLNEMALGMSLSTKKSS